MPYSATLLDHFMNPRQVGELANPTVTAEVVNAACGDRIKLFVVCDNGQITAVKMQAYGCPPTLAAASLLTELMQAKPWASLSEITTDTIVTQLGGLPRGKLHAADLAVEALQQLLATSAALT
jgi:NifU-like protein involved in Fe-S cluster formation